MRSRLTSLEWQALRDSGLEPVTLEEAVSIAREYGEEAEREDNRQ